MKFSIRPLLPADFPAAAQLHVAVRRTAYANFFPPSVLAAMDWQADANEFGEWWQTWPYTPFGFVAEQNDQFVGFVMAGRVQDDPDQTDEPHGYDCEIYKLFVRKDCQGQGMGYQLLSAALQTLQAQGCKQVCIWSYRAGEAAQWYARLGGQIVHQTDHCIAGQAVDVTVFGWPLHQLLCQCQRT